MPRRPTSRDFARCLDLFDGSDPDAVERAPASAGARRSQQGTAATYWQQTERGGWAKAAEQAAG